MLATLLLATLLLGACTGPEPAPPPAATKAELPADVQNLASALTQPEATASGAIVANGELVSPWRSDLVAKVPGRVAAVLVDEGDPVRRGQALLRLETDYLEIEKQRAKAEHARIEAQLADAAKDLARKTELLAKGSVPQAVFDRSQALARQLEAGLEAARMSAEWASKRLDDAVLLSPLDGIVAERRIDVGERLSESTPAFVLVQIAPLDLRFRIAERDLSRVTIGRKVEARFDAFPGQVFSGQISMISAVVDSATRTLAVEARLDNADGSLRPGLFARVEVPGN